MRYIAAKTAENTDVVIYRYYVTAALNALTHNTAGFIKNGATLKWTYKEFIAQAKGEVKEETRTGEEIAAHMKNVLGKLGEA